MSINEKVHKINCKFFATLAEQMFTYCGKWGRFHRSKLEKIWNQYQITSSAHLHLWLYSSRTKTSMSVLTTENSNTTLVYYNSETFKWPLILSKMLGELSITQCHAIYISPNFLKLCKQMPRFLWACPGPQRKVTSVWIRGSIFQLLPAPSLFRHSSLIALPASWNKGDYLQRSWNQDLIIF